MNESCLEIRESKRASSSRRVPIGPTTLSWKCGFFTVIRSFAVGHDLNMMITNNVVIKVKVNIQHENKNDVAGIDCMDRWSEKLDNIHSLPLSLFFFILSAGYLSVVFDEKCFYLKWGEAHHYILF